jgi:hypothetical protein
MTSEHPFSTLGFGDLMGALNDAFTLMETAEEEIAEAQQRHPEAADRLWHSYSLLAPPADGFMQREPAYRAHCREILERVAKGEDTRQGTAAEVCRVLSEASLVAPLKSPAFGLYLRMWQAAGLPDIGDDDMDMDEVLAHHEALEGERIDDLERETRRKITVRDRQLGDITCKGHHNGEPVDCTYAEGPCECCATDDPDSPAA